jgi:hypothetical protein
VAGRHPRRDRSIGHARCAEATTAGRGMRRDRRPTGGEPPRLSEQVGVAHDLDRDLAIPMMMRVAPRSRSPTGESGRCPSTPPQSRAMTTFLVDGHVHLYDVYDRDVFFDSALANLRAAARQLGAEDDWWGCLLLSETSRDDAFDELTKPVSPPGSGRWWFARTDDDGALVASCAGGDGRLLVIAGRQIQTAEGLEVLGLCCRARWPDGTPLRATLDALRSRDAVAVLPWGFGKWWSDRGRLVRDLLMSGDANDIHLGDNGGRPELLGRPALLRLAERRGVKILPGSDPLPIPAEARSVARCGFVLEGTIDLARPASGLKALLRAQAMQPRAFGRHEHLPRFFWNQILLRLPGQRRVTLP